MFEHEKTQEIQIVHMEISHGQLSELIVKVVYIKSRSKLINLLVTLMSCTENSKFGCLYTQLFTLPHRRVVFGSSKQLMADRNVALVGEW